MVGAFDQVGPVFVLPLRLHRLPAGGRKPTPEMLPQGERDKLTLRLQQALNTFVDSPRQAVEEADSVFDEVTTHFTNTLTERRRVLRSGAGRARTPKRRPRNYASCCGSTGRSPNGCCTWRRPPTGDTVLPQEAQPPQETGR